MTVMQVFSTIRIIKLLYLTVLLALGELTKSGVVQMIQLGRWFRRQYSPLFNRPVFNGETAAAVEVFSTVYSRTLQSALGFLHGLSLPPTSTQATCAESSRSKFFIQPSSATHFCLKPSCYCAKLSFLHDQFHSEQLEKSEDIGGVVLKGIMRKALNILGRSQSGIEAQRLFDILCGGYVCRNSQLPCDQAGGECVTTEELTGLYSVLKRRNAEMFTSRSFKAMSVGESYYLLQEILARIHQLIDGEETTVEAKKRFFYFSGHDVSIRPLLRALEIKVIKFHSLAKF